MLTAKQRVAAGKAIGGGATAVTRRSETRSLRGNDRVRGISAISEIIPRVEGEYREMPGLSLTLPQAARLWGLDFDTCELALTELIERRVLARGLRGTYIRRASG